MPPEDDLTDTLDRILGLGRECEWIEFKENNGDPQMIGEYISALANSAALEGRTRAYLVWGVNDAELTVVGTTFDPTLARIGQEELIGWLTRQLQPHVYFAFKEVTYQGERLVLLEVSPPSERPVRFGGEEYIRIGSYKKKLRDHPDHEGRLWRLFDNSSFELGVALDNQTVESITELLDYPAYFRSLRLPLPETRSLIIESLERERYIRLDTNSGWCITNLGALLYARELSQFPGLARKATRVIEYQGKNRVETRREQLGVRGYAAGFAGLMTYVQEALPVRETIRGAVRVSETVYPELALRELLANTLIHQDLTLSGTGPTVELFEDRIEFTNPGRPLVDPERFIDSPPQSRNENLAASMRRAGLCEERGSGWDKIASMIELNQLPAPLVEVTDVHTRVVMFAHRPLSAMDGESKLRAVYFHACLQYVNREPMSNSTLRVRLGLSDRQVPQTSRLIRDAVDAGLVVPFDPNAGPRAMRYVPSWANPQRRSLT